MNFRQFFRFTAAAVWLAVASLAQAGEGDAAPVPKVLAVSEQFEAVGRLETNGLVFYVDRADSNAPVLNARLAVEFDGKSVDATFRPEQGDYLIADREWLQPLRAVGHHPLALTLIAGTDSDLLAGELQVENGPETALTVALAPGSGLGGVLWALPGFLLGALALRWGWQRLRRQRRGGVA